MTYIITGLPVTSYLGGVASLSPDFTLLAVKLWVNQGLRGPPIL